MSKEQAPRYSLEFWGPGEEDLARKLQEEGVEVSLSGTVYRAVFPEEHSLRDCLCDMAELTDRKVYVREG
ncbi:hypothetical protein C8P63_12177 [Melghirimyces profundicolus]|uniref:Uncharacterized protein n=1 Tax=Melghirimyces profundicolus TaxID=1242148 RepID=A0A2T6BGL2_9BACL|nr:hypothetical protein [Melghirimyces profundicolus]PTX55197.1 hypothetical protein C8P63_12177 [Melghirimyces profundicolus]